MTQTVAQFLQKSFRMISATGPSVPLRGEDYLTGLEILNDLVASYGVNTLLQPIATTTYINVEAGQRDVIFTDELTNPDADYTGGRLSTAQNMWIEYQGVAYPLDNRSRSRYNATARYIPQQGLPLTYTLFFEEDYTRIRLFPAPPIAYVLAVDGVIQPVLINSNMTLTGFPSYYTLFLKYATSREMAFGLNRDSAWSDRHEQRYLDLERIMQNNAPRNLDIGRRDNDLNGATLVASGLFLYDDY